MKGPSCLRSINTITHVRIHTRVTSIREISRHQITFGVKRGISWTGERKAAAASEPMPAPTSSTTYGPSTVLEEAYSTNETKSISCARARRCLVSTAPGSEAAFKDKAKRQRARSDRSCGAVRIRAKARGRPVRTAELRALGQRRIWIVYRRSSERNLIYIFVL